MSLQGFYTTKGLALAAKIAAGTKLTITKVTAGSGITVENASALAQERQTLTAGTAQTGDQTATLPVTLAEVQASVSYPLTELGVYASDPDAGEILYQVFRMDEARSITAGGESVYRFYLKETVGAAGITVSCSPAGLLVDEDLAPVREKIFAVSAPAKSITLAASELTAYISAMPRMLTEDITITVTAGTAAQTLDLSNFYGSGRLRLIANGNVTLAGGVISYFNRIMVSLENFAITGGPSYEKSTVYAYDTAVLYLANCTLTASDGIENAIQADMHGNVAAGGCSITGYYRAVLAAALSLVNLIDCTASGNTFGVYLFWGGIVLLCGSTPNTLGGNANNKNGGIIVKADGTLL